MGRHNALAVVTVETTGLLFGANGAETLAPGERGIVPMKRMLGVLAVILVGGTVVAGSASARPRLTSFYANDEGTSIRLKVNFCDYSGSPNDAFSVVFRMWDANSGYQVTEKRVSGRIYGRCGYAAISVPDNFPVGQYSANAAIVNRATGGMFRNEARAVWIS